MKLAGDNNLYSLENRFKRLKRDSNRWIYITLLLIAFIALPIIAIAIKLLSGPGETWGHIVENLLPLYLSNSLFLFFLCAALVLIIGVGSAWAVSRYEFYGRKYIETCLILPLAIPSYMIAYTYAGIFDYGGTVSHIYQWAGLTYTRLDVMNKYGLAFVLSISLFPYVYVSSRSFFISQANNLIEVSKTLGVSEFKTFFRLILPLSRPAIVAGLILVLMEVLNDYGAASYYGVGTFTTGIFRAWFSIGEPETAVYLSALFMLIVFALILIERWQRRHIVVASSLQGKYMQRKHLSPVGKTILLLLVLVPIMLGFFIPLFQLMYWAYLTADRVLDTSFWHLSLQSFTVAFFAALITVISAIGLIYFSKWSRSEWMKHFSKIGLLGYAVPGAVIAIGIMIPTLFFDQTLISIAANLFNQQIGLFFTGSISILLYAYCVRFLAVAYNPIESMSLKVGDSIPNSSRLLGVGNIMTFLKIELPLIKRGILGAFILVLIDVLKELPLTLILKPFSVNTLAVKAFEYASDEMIMEAAIPSLFVIFTAAIPVIFLNKILIKEK